MRTFCDLNITQEHKSKKKSKYSLLFRAFNQHMKGAASTALTYKP